MDETTLRFDLARWLPALSLIALGFLEAGADPRGDGAAAGY